ncbi:MAG: hypothetical protein ACM3XO_26620 [Bacteroidota bacterium]
MGTGNLSERGSNAPIWAAVITGAVTIIVALLAFPPFQRLFESTATPTLTPTAEFKMTTTPVPTSTVTGTHTATVTATSYFTNTPAFTETHTSTATKTITPLHPTATLMKTLTSTPALPLGMQVVLTANKTSGKIPLRVRFDARNSYLREADGTVLPCVACNYTWQIRQGSGTILGPKTGAGTSEYNFTKRGTYFVSVRVCRNGSTIDCDASGMTITVN